MFSTSLKSLLLVGVVLSSALSASYADAAGSGASFTNGSAVSAASADYALTINASTKWLNVNNGDTVRFNVNGKEFTWHFDTYKKHSIVPLASIAPAGIDAGAVKVYVAMNPHDLN